MYIVVRRCKDAIIFDDSVLYASIFYETLGFWLYLTISAHQLTKSQLSLTTVALLLATGILLAFLVICYQWQKQFAQVTTKDTGKLLVRPIDYMIYIYRMHRVIESSTTGDTRSIMHLMGKLMQHMNHCEQESCPCAAILEQLDDIQLQKDIMERDEELQREEDEAEAEIKNQSRIIEGVPTNSDFMID